MTAFWAYRMQHVIVMAWSHSAKLAVVHYHMIITCKSHGINLIGTLVFRNKPQKTLCLLLGVGSGENTYTHQVSFRIFVKLALDMMKEGGKRNNH